MIGAIALDNTGRQRPVTPSQVALATTIASQVALAVDNAQLNQETQRRLRETMALLSVAQTLGGSLDAQEIARRSARELALLLRADTAIFFSVDETQRQYRAMAGYHVPAYLRESRDFGLSGVPAYAVEARETGRPVACSDVSADPSFDGSANRTLADPPRALIYAPVFSHGLLVGALVSYWWTEARELTEEEIELAAGVAAQMSPVLENARQYAQAQGALAELKATQERLVQSEKSRAAAEIAAGVAHDFNNLLAAVLGRTQYLLHTLDTRAMAPADVRRNLAIIEQAALDGAETVKRLLEFTRATPPAGQAGIVDIRDLLAQTVDVSRYRWKDEAEAQGLRIDVRLEPGEALPVLGNGADLRRVLLNLVLNAIDAMPGGGTLTLSSWAERDTVCVRVRDSGTGMSEEVKARAFDPFFTTKGPQATGLGLSASQGIVRSYGGDITLESTLGQGTSFTLSLAVAAANAPAVSPTVVAARSQALRILVIDDDEAVRAALRDLLMEVGHAVWEAESGAHGLELLDTQPVDLVITDLGMPGMTGWEVAARVKTRWPDRKVALVTGWGAQIGPEELKAHGVDLLLAKPFRFADILALTV